MKRPLPVIALVAICAAGIPWASPAHVQGAQAQPFPVTIVDDMGNHIRITRRPQRILSLDPRDTETLFALNLEKRVVGDGGQDVEGAYGISRNFRYPSEWPSPWGRDYPVKSKQLTHVAGGFSQQVPFNMETIVSAHADLVFSLYSSSQDTTYQKIRDLGVKLVILNPANFQGILHDITVVGRATGAMKQARFVTNVIARQLASTRKAVSRVRSKPTVYYELDASNPTAPFTVGPGTYIDQAIGFAGGKNVIASLPLPKCPGVDCYSSVSLESLIHLNPQIILLADAAYGTTVTSVTAREGWSSISAVVKGKIYPFNDELISRAGPRIAVGIRKMAYRFHPEAFSKTANR